MKSFQGGKYSKQEEITEPMLLHCLGYRYGQESRRRKGGNMAKDSSFFEVNPNDAVIVC